MYEIKLRQSEEKLTLLTQEIGNNNYFITILIPLYREIEPSPRPPNQQVLANRSQTRRVQKLRREE